MDNNSSSILKVLTYNIYNGGGNRIDGICSFIRDSKVDVLGINEAYDWSEDDLINNAKRWGHSFSILLITKSKYHLAITSSFPIEVIDRHTDNMHHGFLIVKIRGMAFIVTHLNPFDGGQRLKEAQLIVESAKQLTQCPIGLMGDLNSLSRLDASLYEANNTIAQLMETEKLRQKFLYMPEGGKQAIDYRTLDVFYQSNFIDVQAAFNDEQNYRYTVPTLLQEDKMHATFMRLDYMLYHGPKIR